MSRVELGIQSCRAPLRLLYSSTEAPIELLGGSFRAPRRLLQISPGAPAELLDLPGGSSTIPRRLLRNSTEAPAELHGGSYRTPRRFQYLKRAEMHQRALYVGRELLKDGVAKIVAVRGNHQWEETPQAILSPGRPRRRVWHCLALPTVAQYISPVLLDELMKHFPEHTGLPKWLTFSFSPLRWQFTNTVSISGVCHSACEP